MTVFNARSKLTDDLFGDSPNGQAISSFFKDSQSDDKITVLDLRDNDFNQSETIEVVIELIDKYFRNTKLVDFRGNNFGTAGSWEQIKALIKKHDVLVDISGTTLVFFNSEQLSSFSKEELKRLIWLENSNERLDSSSWGGLVRNDPEKIKSVIETHQEYYKNSPPKESVKERATVTESEIIDKFLGLLQFYIKITEVTKDSSVTKEQLMVHASDINPDRSKWNSASPLLDSFALQLPFVERPETEKELWECVKAHLHVTAFGRKKYLLPTITGAPGIGKVCIISI